jgi:hypothetical protein
VSGITSGDGNGSRFASDVEKSNLVSNAISAKSAVEFEDVQLLKQEKEVLSSNVTNGTITKNFDSISYNSIEEEAWDLLRESVVNYCGNPIGTIAAKDPNSTNVLNYDQVFIRDFIPSGIAFLLKGEYDIVRNFILYTLQLQVISSSYVTNSMFWLFDTTLRVYMSEMHMFILLILLN